MTPEESSREHGESGYRFKEGKLEDAKAEFR